MRRSTVSPSRAIWPMVLVLMLGVWFFPLPQVAHTAPHEIALDATQYEYRPGRVRVHKGDRVVITLTASDVVHGFYLDGYGLARRVEPGMSERIEFIADKAGKFRYRCSVSCGPLHPFMIGELIVETNAPYWRALGLVVLAGLGMLAHLWQTGRKQSYQEVISGK